MVEIKIRELPESFYESEIREGYYVSEKMKKIWAIQLDLLSEFASVCEKNHLNYFIHLRQRTCFRKHLQTSR